MKSDLHDHLPTENVTNLITKSQIDNIYKYSLKHYDD